MATIEYWIQLENRQWDASPHNIDRITGHDVKTAIGSLTGAMGRDPVDVQLKAPGGGLSTHTRTMFLPLRDLEGNVIDALILRRYKPPTQPDESDAWTVPDDRKVNPWDLNEPDPTDNGTMGTIPGPVIECNVGDSVVVHFRNNDQRTEMVTKEVCFELPLLGKICTSFPVPAPLPIEKRCHSLHPHGFVFRSTSDGAYPLTPPDSSQPVAGPPGPDETPLWSTVPEAGGKLFTGLLKKGDRIPPGGTFIYSWNTIGWPSTAGVWLYHDHSICDMDNIELGAIGIIVIHNPADTEQEVDIRDPNDPTKLDPAFLPDGSANGSPIHLECFPIPPLPILPHDLEGLGQALVDIPGGHTHTLSAAQPRHGKGEEHEEEEEKKEEEEHKGEKEHKEEKGGRPVLERVLKRGDLLFELDDRLATIIRFCLFRYDTPPSKALYLQLYHTFGKWVSGMMMINGRTFLGNTPTMIAGTSTRMRFGVVGMGTAGNGIHTFHIHGHRWVVPGPRGTTLGAIQSSPQVQAVSQFEDTRIFGPANSFVFTIDGQSGSFMRAGGPSPDDALGEWHMHCHVLDHMMMGMMGSLLIVNAGDPAFALPVGVACEHEEGMPPDGDHDGDTTPTAVTLKIANFAFETGLKVKSGGTVTFKNDDSLDHSVIWDTAGPATVPPMGPGTSSAPVTMPTVTSEKVFNLHCGIHPSMLGSIKVVP